MVGERLGLGRGGELGPLRLPLKMAAARNGRHFLVGVLSISAAQNGGSGRRTPWLSAPGLPWALSGGVEAMGCGEEPSSGVGDLSR